MTQRIDYEIDQSSGAELAKLYAICDFNSSSKLINSKIMGKSISLNPNHPIEFEAR